MGTIFFSPGDSHTEGLLVLLHLGLEGVTEVATDPKGRFVSFKVTPSNDRVLCVYAPSGHSTREQLARGCFFEGLQNYMENKNERNESKIIRMDKMEMDGKNKTLYRYLFNYSLSKIIVDNGLRDLWRRENPDSSEFTSYDKSSGTTSRIDRVYADIKIASNTKIHHIMVTFTDHYNAIFIDKFPSKLKLEKVHGTLIILFYCKLEYSLITKTFFFLLKTQNATTLQQVTGEKTLNLVLKKMLELFLKIQENIRISILKRRLQNVYKKENFKPEIKPMI